MFQHIYYDTLPCLSIIGLQNNVTSVPYNYVNIYRGVSHLKDVVDLIEAEHVTRSTQSVENRADTSVAPDTSSTATDGNTTTTPKPIGTASEELELTILGHSMGAGISTLYAGEYGIVKYMFLLVMLW